MQIIEKNVPRSYPMALKLENGHILYARENYFTGDSEQEARQELQEAIEKIHNRVPNHTIYVLYRKSFGFEPIRRNILGVESVGEYWSAIAGIVGLDETPTFAWEPEE